MATGIQQEPKDGERWSDNFKFLSEPNARIDNISTWSTKHRFKVMRKTFRLSDKCPCLLMKYLYLLNGICNLYSRDILVESEMKLGKVYKRNSRDSPAGLHNTIAFLSLTSAYRLSWLLRPVVNRALRYGRPAQISQLAHETQGREVYRHTLFHTVRLILCFTVPRLHSQIRTHVRFVPSAFLHWHTDCTPSVCLSLSVIFFSLNNLLRSWWPEPFILRI